MPPSPSRRGASTPQLSETSSTKKMRSVTEGSKKRSPPAASDGRTLRDGFGCKRRSQIRVVSVAARVSVGPLREYLLVSAQDHDVNACPVALLDSSRMLRQWGLTNSGRRGPSARKEEPLPKSSAGVPGRVSHPRRHRFRALACSSRAKLPISYRNHRLQLRAFGHASQSPARARPSAPCGLTIALVEFMSQSSPGVVEILTGLVCERPPPFCCL
jgi:hypothetical protein